MSDWIAVGPVPGGARGFSLSGGTIVEEAQGETVADMLLALGGSDRVVRIGEGGAESVPCGVLPCGGVHVPVVTQKDPPDVVSAWVRIWVAGVLASREHWDGVVCATQGDVTHWLHVSADEIVSVQSVLTPRLVAAMGGAAVPSPDAMADTISRPERLAAHLRQAEVAGDAAAVTGHLLGAELAATKPYWLGQEVVVVAEDPAEHLAGLQAQGAFASAMSVEQATRGGLSALGRTLGFA